MSSPDLLAICAAAFTAVFVLLCLLAAVMWLILTVFPKREEVTDSAMLAAVASVYSSLFPGTRINKIEEIQ